MSTVIRVSAYMQSTYDWATKSYDLDPQTPLAFQATISEGADLSGLPKSVGVKLSKQHGGEHDGETLGHLFINLRSNRTNGGVNEAGAKRIKRLLAYAEAQGWIVEDVWRVANSYPTLNDFLAVLP